MTSFLLRRLLAAVPTLVGITALAFAILNLLPDDPLIAWSPGGATASAEALARVRAELRVDRGPVERYLDWGLALTRGDLGTSLRDGRPVGRVLADALPWTVLLNLCALVMIYALAVPFGLLGASAPGSSLDRLGSRVLLAVYALPSFAAALLLQEFIAVRLGWLPLQGAVGRQAGSETVGLLSHALDLARHLVLPTLCLALAGWAFVARYSRAACRSVSGREFLAVARAKGLSRSRAYYHVAANAAVPLITLLAGIVPSLVGGSLIVEQAFSWPGLGRLYVASIEGRDYPVVLGLTLLGALLVLAGQLLADLLYLLVDPRLRDELLMDGLDA